MVSKLRRSALIIIALFLVLVLTGCVGSDKKAVQPPDYQKYDNGSVEVQDMGDVESLRVYYLKSVNCEGSYEDGIYSENCNTIEEFCSINQTGLSKCAGEGFKRYSEFRNDQVKYKGDWYFEDNMTEFEKDIYR